MSFNPTPESHSVLRFEQEWPEEATFLQAAYASGGRFLRPRYGREELYPLRQVPRNASCPCGSGQKTKRCHVLWTTNTPGLAL